ncbi:Hsp70 family protein [Shigella flexneri]
MNGVARCTSEAESNRQSGAGWRHVTKCRWCSESPCVCFANYRIKVTVRAPVALGAAIQAACRLRSEDIEEVILTEICPYWLGVEVNAQGYSGIFSPIIERNTTVPVSRVKLTQPCTRNRVQLRLTSIRGQSKTTSGGIRDVPIEENGLIRID